MFTIDVYKSLARQSIGLTVFLPSVHLLSILFPFSLLSSQSLLFYSSLPSSLSLLHACMQFRMCRENRILHRPSGPRVLLSNLCRLRSGICIALCIQQWHRLICIYAWIVIYRVVVFIIFSLFHTLYIFSSVIYDKICTSDHARKWIRSANNFYEVYQTVKCSSYS